MKKATPAKKPVAAKTKAGASSIGTKNTKTPDATKKAADSKGANAAAKPKELPKLEPRIINSKQIPGFLGDEDRAIRNAPVWPLVVDKTGIATTFIRYQNVNIVEGLNSENMVPESLRKALLGAIRYGKPLVFDMTDIDLCEVFKVQINQVMPELFDMVMDKSILKEESYKKLIKNGDGDEYDVNNFSEFYMDNFMFIILTNNPNPPAEFLERMQTVIIE